MSDDAPCLLGNENKTRISDLERRVELLEKNRPSARQ
jgi:hypothetical protein